ncbi:CmcJ/NvfI family oxidoreductase [Xylophilus sp.]|uniref:CmcJ/NvfI family oxidoreductase n=1 Tax=Xylophilus sp. TaxID=2653893 RepID=UPI0013BE6683|nr:CmcJ/NvfI family oxidoreductase [Xylophilus sp.]KAF1048729.1 MAG: hypothetical protein GAK38_01173 [Xylophilus sp.]
MSTTIQDPIAPAVPAGEVEAELNYLRAGSPRPVSYTFEPPPGVPWTTGEVEPHRVRIRDARPLAALGELSLDRSGFERIVRPSALADFSDEAAIRAVYYPESEAILREATGAEKIVIFDHTLRDSALGSRDRSQGGLREPVGRVHDDQTFTSGPRRVRDHLPADEAERRLKRRFAIVNLWRPLATVEQWPLALCDARSIAPQDLVPSSLVYPDKVGETYSFLYSPAHRWYYFPRLTPAEALLLKIYDAREDVARLTAHTAFDDPTSPADAAPRRSIELRALVFWAD